MDEKLYNELNKGWKTTSRIIFGDELGELDEYEEWLRGYFPKLAKRKSHLSGKEVTIALDHYHKDAKFVSLDEVRENPIDPLTINEVKDIDSILEAISEKWEYCGNRVLGNSMGLDSADIAVDSQNVAEGINLQAVSNSYLAYNATEGKFLYGTGILTGGEFLIRFTRGNTNSRCFESTLVTDCSDLYLTHHAYACHDLMFSFHQRNKRNMIGNLQLSREKYSELKKKLLSEIVGEIKKNKKFPSIYSLIPNERLTGDYDIKPEVKQTLTSFEPIEKSFSTLSKVLLKRDLPPLRECEDWLSRRIVTSSLHETTFGTQARHPNYGDLNVDLGVPEKRIVTYAEAMELGKLHMGEEQITGLESVRNWIAQFGCFTAEFDGGVNTNIMDSVIVLSSSNIYKNTITIKSEKAAINSWCLFSKHVFGSHWMFNCQFSLNCYNSRYLNRCLEVDSSVRCNDVMFSHNCEALTESMFCFNTKGKRYNIGNAQFLPDKYKLIKESLLEQMVGDILEKKYDKWDIFNIVPKGVS